MGAVIAVRTGTISPLIWNPRLIEMLLNTFDDIWQIAGHPRNNLMTENTFLKVEKQDEKGKWHVVATDAHFETT